MKTINHETGFWDTRAGSALAGVILGLGFCVMVLAASAIFWPERVAFLVGM